MKTIEIALDDRLHRKLQKASKATSRPMEQLIRNLLTESLRRTVPRNAFSTKLLAEGYQVMAEENAATISDSLAAQVMAMSNQNGGNDGFDQ
jgi:predicted transcriptional regulator